jgi:hypothetical protein
MFLGKNENREKIIVDKIPAAGYTVGFDQNLERKTISFFLVFVIDVA